MWGINAMKFTAIVCAAVVFGITSHAHAYGPEGHALIADMAQANLMPAAKAEVLRLLALEGANGLDDVSSWADDYRSSHPETSSTHFVDIPLFEQSYDEMRDCHYDKDNKRVAELTCIVARLLHFAQVLSDSSKPDKDRLDALKWVTHLLGDVHQPLHAADNQDRGGNSISVAYFDKANNLHAIWDSGIIERQYGWILGPKFSFDHAAVRQAAEGMNAQITTEQRRAWAPQFSLLEQNIVQWANESHLLASAAYLNVPATKGDDWQGKYQATFWPIVREQLQKASVRLSAVLNLMLASTERCPNVQGVAFYAGPYAGTEDKLSPDDFFLDTYCASLFKKSRYPNGFVGVYGSSRISEVNKQQDLAIAAANNELYRGVRAFAAKWTSVYGGKLPILTGAGPGLMEAASRGATDAGGPSIGYTTYYDPKHDPRTAFWRFNGKPIISDGLIFTSVAIRENSMLAHSAVIVIAPGGTGTEWEIFQAVETLKSNQLTSVPVFLVGNKAIHWAKFYDMVDNMVERGTLKHDEFYSRITHVENLDELFDAVQTRLGFK
jgi:predicted Rossmann-fold nucleotide-binding protein